MKEVKLEKYRKSKHPSSVGKDREHFENKMERRPGQISDLVKAMDTAKSKTLKLNYLVSEIIAKVAATDVYDE